MFEQSTEMRGNELVEKKKKGNEYYSDSNGGGFCVPNLFDDTGNSSWSLQNRRLKTTKSIRSALNY